MRFLYSTCIKATCNFRGFHHRCWGSSSGTRLLSSTAMSKSNHLHQSPFNSSLFMFLHHHYATRSLARLDEITNSTTNYKELDVNIISIENVKPASPTPPHLRTFNFSLLDQIYSTFYTPLVLFLPNTDHATIDNIITKRSRLLKNSLSQLLTHYYPFAGEIIDNSHIDCNDNGVYFVEARVNQTLQDFLRRPDDGKVRELIPHHPSTTESSWGNHVASVQVNIFNCGGIALSTSLTHKIVDGTSYFTFLKAWAAAARGSHHNLAPSFVASHIFPTNPSLKYSVPAKVIATNLPVSKRFVFDSTAMASLKAQPVDTPTITSTPRGPTRMEATGALIWKAAAKAAAAVRPFGPHSPHALVASVNFRRRALPPLPEESIGNLFYTAAGICFPANKLELPALMGQMRESIAKIDADFVDALKGEKGHETLNGLLKKWNDLFEGMDEGDCLILTSLLNSGVYEIDFGWGKAIWFYHVNPGCKRIVSLNDTIKSGGVEAIVSLSAEEMEVFERNPEVLSYATVDPSPLQ